MMSRIARSPLSGLCFSLMIVLAWVSPSVAELPESPDGTLRAVIESVADHKPQVVWHALPASYQTDVNSVIQAFATQADADIYNRGFAVTGKLAQVLGAKKDFILNSAMLTDMGMDTAKLGENWDAVVGVVNTLATSDLRTIESLSTLNVEAFLSTTGAQMLEHMASLSEVAGEGPSDIEQMRDAEIEVVSWEGDDAVLKVVETSGQTQELSLKRVEGKWVPAEMAEDWDSQITKTKAQIAEMAAPPAEQKGQMLGLLNAADTTLDQLNAANSQQEFDQAMGMAAGMIMGAMMMGGAQ